MNQEQYEEIKNELLKLKADCDKLFDELKSELEEEQPGDDMRN